MESPNVYLGSYVVSDADLTTLLHPNPLEAVALYKRVSVQFHQRTGEHYLFDTAALKGTDLAAGFIAVYPQSLEALVQHHALQVLAGEERSAADLPQTRRSLEHFQSGESEAFFPDLF